MTLLDVGCGWGATMRRAVERYDVNVVGLTPSRNQQAYAERAFAETPSDRSRRVLLAGWNSSPNPWIASCRSARSNISARTAGSRSSTSPSTGCPTTG